MQVSPDSYPVAFRWQKRGDAEDFGEEIEGQAKGYGKDEFGEGSFLLSVFPTMLCMPLKATGYESE